MCWSGRGDFNVHSHVSSFPGAFPPLLDCLLLDFKLNEDMLLPATGRLGKMFFLCGLIICFCKNKLDWKSYHEVSGIVRHCVKHLASELILLPKTILQFFKIDTLILGYRDCKRCLMRGRVRFKPSSASLCHIQILLLHVPS